MPKRGQVTTFIVLGIVIFAVIAVVFYLSFSGQGIITSAERNSIRDYVEGCLEAKIDEAIAGCNTEQIIDGFSDCIKGRIDGDNGFRECINQPRLSSRFIGLDIGVSSGTSNVFVSGQSINEYCFVDVVSRYPLVISKGGSRVTVNDFNARHTSPNC